MTVPEAAAEARGLGLGLQPALPAEAMAAAVNRLLRDLGCYGAPLATEEVAGAAFSPVEPAEVADSLADAMRLDERGDARRTGAAYASKVAADQLVKQLTMNGYVVMRPRPGLSRREPDTRS